MGVLSLIGRFDAKGGHLHTNSGNFAPLRPFLSEPKIFLKKIFLECNKTLRPRIT